MPHSHDVFISNIDKIIDNLKKANILSISGEGSHIATDFDINEFLISLKKAIKEALDGEIETTIYPLAELISKITKQQLDIVIPTATIAVIIIQAILGGFGYDFCKACHVINE